MSLQTLRLVLSALRLIPHMLVLKARRDPLLLADIERWRGLYFPAQPLGLGAFVRLMTFHPEFRSVFYFRAGVVGKLFSGLCPGMPTLFIRTARVGPGLLIQHGFATIVAAKSIGADCWINQQVTIGYANASDQPVLHDQVTIHAGAKVIGAVTIGCRSVVGANAVVVKDVPADCTVVGVPARIVRRNGQRVDEAL